LSCVSAILAYGLGGGLIGKILGLTGLDVLEAKLRKIPKVEVATFTHDSYQLMTERAERAAHRCHIVLVGQSAGGNGAVEVSHRLYRKSIPIAFMVLYDPAERMELKPIPPNVASVLNFYQKQELLGRATVVNGSKYFTAARVENRLTYDFHISMAHKYHDEILRHVRFLTNQRL